MKKSIKEIEAKFHIGPEGKEPISFWESQQEYISFTDEAIPYLISSVKYLKIFSILLILIVLFLLIKGEM